VSLAKAGGGGFKERAVCDRLLDAGATVKAQDSEGYTAYDAALAQAQRGGGSGSSLQAIEFLNPDDVGGGGSSRKGGGGGGGGGKGGKHSRNGKKASFSSEWSSSGAPAASITASALADIEGMPPNPACAWRRVQSEEGKPYYFHRKTDKVQWAVPEDWDHHPPSAHPPPSAPPVAEQSLADSGTPA
jgi:hypothetical protein